MAREIIWTWQRRVHDSFPFLRGTFLHLKLQVFPVRIDHHVDVIVSLRSSVQAECEAAGVVGQIDRRARSIPEHILPPKPAAAQAGMSFAERDHVLEETKDVLICPESAPVQPSSFVVLVIGIVVAELRVQELVPGPEHRSPVREKQQATEILNLLPAQREHRRWHTFFPFVPAIPTVVLVRAILIIVTIRPVTFAVVGNEIVQREAVVGGYKVHALVGVISVSASVGKKVIAAVEPPHQVRDHPRIALDEAADIVAKASVPLQPSYTGESSAELKSTGIPGFRDQP